MFMQKLRQSLQKAGYDEKLYSAHSFRAGGLNFAQRVGVPSEMLQNLGDWRSDAYLKYLEPSDWAREVAGLLVRHRIVKQGL